MPPTVGQHTKRVLRNHRNLATPKFNSSTFKKSFVNSAITKWNSLPDSVKEIKDINKFMKVIKPPSKPNRLYYHGHRNLNILLARLRMKCSPLNSHLHALHVIDNPSCNCGYTNEDSDHYFLNCPLYSITRQTLHNTVNQISINVYTSRELIFGSPELSIKQNYELCTAVLQYISETNRFN